MTLERTRNGILSLPVGYDSTFVGMTFPFPVAQKPDLDHRCESLTRPRQKAFVSRNGARAGWCLDPT